jgi:hypothetical protein
MLVVYSESNKCYPISVVHSRLGARSAAYPIYRKDRLVTVERVHEMPASVRSILGVRHIHHFISLNATPV